MRYKQSVYYYKYYTHNDIAQLISIYQFRTMGWSVCFTMAWTIFRSIHAMHYKFYRPVCQANWAVLLLCVSGCGNVWWVSTVWVVPMATRLWLPVGNLVWSLTTKQLKYSIGGLFCCIIISIYPQDTDAILVVLRQKVNMCICYF